jgi:hypothetical protein
MRVAIGIWKHDLEQAIRTYQLLSERWCAPVPERLRNCPSGDAAAAVTACLLERAAADGAHVLSGWVPPLQVHARQPDAVQRGHAPPAAQLLLPDLLQGRLHRGEMVDADAPGLACAARKRGGRCGRRRLQPRLSRAEQAAGPESQLLLADVHLAAGHLRHPEGVCGHLQVGRRHRAVDPQHQGNGERPRPSVLPAYGIALLSPRLVTPAAFLVLLLTKRWCLHCRAATFAAPTATATASCRCCGCSTTPRAMWTRCGTVPALLSGRERLAGPSQPATAVTS